MREEAASVLNGLNVISLSGSIWNLRILVFYWKWKTGVPNRQSKARAKNKLSTAISSRWSRTTATQLWKASTTPSLLPVYIMFFFFAAERA